VSARATSPFVRVVVALASACALLELAARGVARSTQIDERPVDIQSRDALRAVAARLGRGGESAGFVGSSLVFGRHLEAIHGARWPQYTLSSRYASLARQSDHPVHAVNLGVEGVLFDELDCIAAEALAQRPAQLFVQVSPRPFATDFADGDADGETHLERGLCANRARLLDRLTGPLRDAAFDHLAILHHRDVAQFAWLSAPPRLALVSALRARLGLATPGAQPTATVESEDDWDAPASEEEAAVLREMAWRIRAARRYDSIEVRASHPQAASLRALIRTLAGAGSTRVVLFYLEEDMSSLAEQADLSHFARQRAAFVAMIERLARPARIPFIVVRTSEIGPHYVDHVHVDAEGYRRLAERLAAGAREGTP
jgi:hypothetical protein